jgi:methionyl-tRNA synthetase
MPGKVNKFYITTPIYYVNDIPHIGHAYTTIAADVLARYYRMKGKEVYFLTGTDENSQKNVEAAKKVKGEELKVKSEKEIVTEYVNEMSAKWQETWDSLDITNDDFIRTTEPRHKKAVKKFFEAVFKNGDIYKGIYEGLYCPGCEAYVSEMDLENGKCPFHKIAPKKIKEENYFFRFKKYEAKLLDYIEKNPDFIEPEARRNEVVNYISHHLEDISISRLSQEWGIPVPIDKKQVIYVWFDALINYLTAVGYGTDEEKFNKWWPADLHLVGKDIIKFHCALWPAMLMSAGLPLPKKVFAHGFFTIGGQKISKSLGNVLDPVELVNKYGIDEVRYFLLREISFGEDGDISLKRLEERYNTELANGLGNLVARVLTMCEKYFNGKIPPLTWGSTGPTWRTYQEAVEKLQFHQALIDIWDLISKCDKLINDEAPWQLIKIDKKRVGEVIYTLLETLRHIAWLLAPFMPLTSDLILEQLGLALKVEKKKSLEKAKEWGGLIPGKKIKKGKPLFPRLT